MTATIAPPSLSGQPPKQRPSVIETEGRHGEAHRHTDALRGLLRAARPHQWIKNATVLMIPGLGFYTLGVAGLVDALVACSAFCLASSSVYLLNDTLDREADRHHPVKRHRPIASGVVSPALATVASGAAALTALALGFLVSPMLVAIIAAYLLLTASYSLGLKRLAWVDVAVLAAGFVLRVVAGAVAVGAAVPLLLLTAVFAGAAFVALGKRRSELVLLGDDASSHRSALGTYRLRTIDAGLAATQAVAVVTFGLWVLALEFEPAGAGLALLGAAGFWEVLNAYRRRLMGGGGGDPARELLANHTLLPGLLVVGLVAFSAGII